MNRFGSILLIGLLVVALLPTAPVHAQQLSPATARFRHVSVSEGLSQASVLALTQDRNGFIWIGTQDGLNRYDGVEVVTYRYQRQRSDSLASSRVDALAVDHDGNLWVGTPQGLHRYLPERDGFERYGGVGAALGSVQAGSINCLLVDRAGRLWVGGAGLTRWDPATRRFKAIGIAVPGRVLALADAGDDGLWIGTSGGLLHRAADDGRVTPVDLGTATPAPITTLFAEHSGRLWVGSNGFGLFRLDASTATDHAPYAVAPVVGLADARVLDLLKDRSGQLWVGTEVGLDLLPDADAALPSVMHFVHARHNRDGIGSGRVVSLMQDNEDAVWVGTWTGGVGHVATRGLAMISFHPDLPEMAGMRDGSVLALCPDPRQPDLLWLGTRKGLYRFDRHAHELIDIASTQAIPVAALLCEQDGLWLGGATGLFRWADGRLEHVSLPAPVDKVRIRRLMIDGERLWIGADDALFLLERDTLRLLARVALPGQASLIRVLDDRVVLAGNSAGNGLAWLRRNDGQILQIIHAQPGVEGALQSNAATALHQAADGRWWLGTQGGGLQRMAFSVDGDPAKTRFWTIDSSQGLGADAIGSILEDGQGRLWLSTTRGISRFNPQTGVIRNYGSADGAADAGYYIGSAARLPSGEMAFGGLNGITVFDPARIQQAPRPLPPWLGAPEIDGRRQVLGAAQKDPAHPGGQRLQAPALAVRSLRLPFTAPYFHAPHDLRFSYQLQGFDPDWIEVDGKQRAASYTNLPPGQYRFRVRSGNLDGLWSEREASLEIVLDPAWWQTSLARVGFVLAGAGLLFGGYRWRVRQLRRQKQTLQREVAARTDDLLKLGEIGKELTNTLDVEQAMDRVYRQVSARLDAHVFLIGNYLPELQLIRIDYAVEGGARLPAFAFPMSETDRPAVWCVREGRELITATQAGLLNYVQNILPAKVGALPESFVYLPLIVEDRVIGCVSVQSPHQHAYSADQLEFLRVLASYTAIALNNAQSYARLDQAMTATREALADLHRTQGQLVTQEKMAALGTLTAGVAHEINNPTNFADGAVQNLVELHQHLHDFLRNLAGADAEPDVLAAFQKRFNELAEMTSIAREGHERIKSIVRDLRQFTRLDEAGRKRIAIAEPIQSTVNLIRTKYDQVEFQLELADNPELECQPAKLGQVFMNLIVNACQAVAECADDRLGIVRISTLAAGDQVAIGIEDNGTGMSEATRARIFEPFFTTKGVGTGTGLGLAVSLGIIKEHAGSIEVESTPGQGSRFTLRLPLSGADARP